MKDIDFDELDKAVTSLMGNVRGDDRQSDQPVTHSLTVPTTLRDDERPEYATIRRAAARIGGETITRPLETTAIISEEPAQDDLSLTSPAPTPQVASEEPVSTDDTSAGTASATTTQAVEKRGRFMDVFHPSSDMKQRTNSRTSAKDEAVTVADQLVTQDEILPGAAKVSHEAQTLAPLEEETQDAPVEATHNDVTAVIDEEVQEEASSHAPLTTPFLPGTKVEKRPLGGGMAPEAFPDESVAPLIHRAADDPAVAPQPAETVPDELQNDVMAIELAGTPAADLLPDNNDMYSPSNDVATPLDVSTPPEEVVSEPEAQPIAADVTPVVEMAAPTPETPAGSPEQSGAIYDTTEYHAPVVAHPAKHSSWMWIVLIIVIIIVGAAGGAIAYWLTSTQ